MSETDDPYATEYFAKEPDVHTIVKYITPACIVCGEHSVLHLVTAELKAYRSGTLITEAFPTLSDSERELFKTGIHDACWDELL